MTKASKHYKYYKDWSGKYICIFGETNLFHMYFTDFSERQWQYGGHWDPEWTKHMEPVSELEVITVCGKTCPKELGLRIHDALRGL